MDFDLAALLEAHRRDGYELYGKYLNPQQPRVLHAIGFDKVYERAEGAYLYDADGNAYADFLAGFGVFAAGRNHPVIKKALHDALDAQLADWTQFDCPPLPGLLAEKLLAKAPGLDRVFFCNSGTEAVESALKFARYATGRGRILYCDHAFHGLTTGSLSVNGSAEFRPGFDPLLPAVPVPVGAMLAKGPVFEKIYSSMDRVMVHSTTFKGGVLAMTAGLASLAVLDDEGLTENAARTGTALATALKNLAERFDVLADVRGRGLMIGVEFDKPSSLRARTSWNMLQKARVGLFAQMVVVALFQRHRVLTQVSGDHMEGIKLIPPLMIGDAEVKLFNDAFAEVLEDASRARGLIWDFGRTLVKQAVRN